MNYRKLITSISLKLIVLLVMFGVAVYSKAQELPIQEWERSFEVENKGSAAAVAVDSSSNVIIAGDVWDIRYNYDHYIIKYSGTDGSKLWQVLAASGAPPFSSHIICMKIDSTNNIIITSPSQNEAYITAKYNGADGSVLWEKSLLELSGEIAVAVDSQDNIIVTCTSRGDHYIIKYNGADGSILWESHHDGMDITTPLSLAIDLSNNIVVSVAENDYNNGAWRGYLHTIKYNGIDGKIHWEKSIEIGIELMMEFGSIFGKNNIAIDSLGNPIIAFTDAKDYHTVKLSGSNGAIIWETVFDGSDEGDNRGDSPKSVIIDSEDNVVVTGHSYMNSVDQVENFDYYTFKYSGIDGSIIWQKSCDTGGYDSPSDMIVDSQNNIVITGNFTVKHSGRDGTIWWRKIFNGNKANVIAIDHSDNVIVTGEGLNGFHTIKYFSGEALLPSTKTHPATSLGVYENRHTDEYTSGTATFNGTVTANGDRTMAWFEYGTNTFYGETTPPQLVGSEWGSAEIIESVKFLNFSTTYHVRTAASNIKGTTYGDDMSFVTANNPHPVGGSSEDDGGCLIATIF